MSIKDTWSIIHINWLYNVLLAKPHIKHTLSSNKYWKKCNAHNKNMFFKPTSNMVQHMFWHVHKGCFNFQTIMNRIRTVLDTLPISMSSKLLDLNRCSLFVVLCCQAPCFLLNMFYKHCALLAGACSATYCLTCLRDVFERYLRVPLDMLLEMCLWEIVAVK